MPGYRFSDFAVSPKRRVLTRGGRELPLIPRYFDLLVLLLERRHEAVHRNEIFDRVWKDVVVSDSALNQAIRTIRRTLEDDPREPKFIRTVSRHGYRFVFADVIEAGEEQTEAAPDTPRAAASGNGETMERLLERIASPARSEAEEEERREAAELLHAMGTADVLRRLGTRSGHARARALLRDARWDAPGAGDVPVAGAPDSLAVAREVVALRLRRAARLVARRWAGASIGAGLAGASAGLAGGVLLAAVHDGGSPAQISMVLAAIGAGCGALAGAGVGAGLAVAEATARSARFIALVIGAAVGGALVGSIAQWLGRAMLSTLTGLHVEIGGGLEGLVLGAAAGLGYAIATRRAVGGLAAPRGSRRVATGLLTALLCGAAALLLTIADRPLVGGTLHLIGRAAEGAQVSLAPLGRLVGEPDFGPVTRAVLGFGEAAIFGFGLSIGLTKR